MIAISVISSLVLLSVCLMACRIPSVSDRDYHVVIEQLDVSPDLPRDEFVEVLSLKPVIPG